MSKKLLLADGSATLQKIAAICLSHTDFEIVSVKTGPEALRLAKEALPDVIALDTVAPDSAGYDACAQLRSDPDLAHLPVLLLSGTSLPIDEARAAQCGASDFLQKPFDSQLFIEKVHTLAGLPVPAPLPGVRVVKRPTAAPVAATPAPVVPPTAMPVHPPQAPTSRPPMAPMSQAARPQQPVASRPPMPGMNPNMSRPPMAPMSQTARPQQPVASRPPMPGMNPNMSRPPMAPMSQTARPQQPVASRPPMPGMNPNMSRPPPPATMRGAPVPGMHPAMRGSPMPMQGQVGVGYHSQQYPPAHQMDPYVQEQMLRAVMQSVSREVIERVVWEVVPQLAETIIREELERLIQSRGGV